MEEPLPAVANGDVHGGSRGRFEAARLCAAGVVGTRADPSFFALGGYDAAGGRREKNLNGVDSARRWLLKGLGMAGASALTGCRHARVAKAGPLRTTPSAEGGSEGYRGKGSLKDHAAAKGFLYGCAVDVGMLRSDGEYARLVREQAGIIVGENAMKWDAVHPALNRWAWADADELVRFAESERMKVRGHTLVWHRQLPGWVAETATVENAGRILREHVSVVMGRYAGRIHSWDVVNEAVEVADGRTDGLRESVWLKLLGPEYIEEAFKIARNADPQALLCMNEYGLEGEDEESRRKRGAMLVLLRRLKARHVPVDAVGVQSHLRAGGKSGAGLLEFLRALREMGLQVFLTEMDVNDRDLGADIGVRDGAVAATYGNYLETVLQARAVRVVMTWGITDRRSWLNTEGGRPDGQRERCLPFDDAGKPKAAFFAMRRSFDGRRL